LTTSQEKNKEREKKYRLARHGQTPRSMIMAETRDWQGSIHGAE
jgi:hypothetical protein